jgi:hypothetical protein
MAKTKKEKKTNSTAANLGFEATLWLAADKLRSNIAASEYKLVDLYGEEHGSKVQYAEAFEVCEYGSSLTPERQRELFPFIPA